MANFAPSEHNYIEFISENAIIESLKTLAHQWLQADIFLILLNQAGEIAQEVNLQPSSPPEIVLEANALNASAYMRFPLIPNGQVVIASTHQDFFTEEQVNVGRSLAVLASTQVENQILREQQHREEMYQQAAYKMAMLIHEDLGVAEVQAEVVKEATRLTGADETLLLLPKNPSTLMITAKMGNLGVAELYDEYEMGTGILGQAAVLRQIIVVDNYAEYPHARFKDVISCAMAIPLLFNDELIGVLGVAKGLQATQIFKASDQRLLELLAPLAATALEKARRRDTVRQERSQLHTLLDYIRAPIMVFNNRNCLEMANPEAHIVGKRIGLSLYGMLEQNMQDIMTRLPAGITLPSEFPVGVPLDIDLGDGGEFVLRVAEITDENGETEKYVVVGQEVTRERRLDRAKSELLYIISHDLGNILTLALGYAGLAAEGDLTPDQYKMSIKKVYEALVRARALIRDVVALEQIYNSEGRVVRPYSLVDVVEEVCRVYRDFAQDRDQKLIWSHDGVIPQLMGNSALIKQAVENLVTNAIKYSPDGGSITVHLSTEGANVVLAVTDTGFGISEEELPRIWERYYRVEEHRRMHIPGTGLGLPLVMSVIKSHGGNITVTSQVGTGSTFRVNLPLNFKKNETSELHPF